MNLFVAAVAIWLVVVGALLWWAVRLERRVNQAQNRLDALRRIVPIKPKER